MTITDEYVDRWPDGIRIEVSDPAYDGWCIDVFMMYRTVDSRTLLQFLAFQCVDMDDQVKVLEMAIDKGLTGLKGYGVSDAQAEQVIEMFRHKRGLRLIEGGRAGGLRAIEGIVDHDDDGSLGFHATKGCTTRDLRRVLGEP